ncbi:MAG: MBL fold metallo-hydrolase [Armatimonadota bacterium]
MTTQAQVTIEYHLLDTGYCLASEHHVLHGGRRHTLHCHALVALWRHPRHGWGLWDTGYAPRIWDATTAWPYRLYRHATPFRFGPEQAVIRQLPRFGLQASDIRHIILSHFHADHIAGLRDFPEARIIVSAAAYADIGGRRGFAAIRRALLPALLPDDLHVRAQCIASFTGPALPVLGPTHDLFGDGTLQLIDLPGHARGQMGLLMRSPRRQALFVADSAWISQSFRQNRPPHPCTHLICDNAHQLRDTLGRLHAFSLACPDVDLLPTHCPEVYAREFAV